MSALNFSFLFFKKKEERKPSIHQKSVSLKPDSRRLVMAKEQHYIDFDEYIRQGEPSQREAAYAWSTAIGLQAVDGLQVSDYLLELARKNIEGELTMDEVSDLLDKHYAKKRKNRTAWKEYQTYTRVESVNKEDCRMGRQFERQTNLVDPTSNPISSGQVPEQATYKHRTSTGQVWDKLGYINPDVISLIQVIGNQKLSVKEMMMGMELKGRDNFLKVHLNPAISEGFVRLLYPDTPRHPRQKYLLTAKGVLLFKEIMPQP